MWKYKLTLLLVLFTFV